MTLGTVATHPTPTALLALAGVVVAVALKIAGEERALAAEFGPRWDAYRARVPRLVPRLSRGRRR
jgi:protein-S-isoprenylcysteine O-methyltransferase Ste14